MSIAQGAKRPMGQFLSVPSDVNCERRMRVVPVFSSCSKSKTDTSSGASSPSSMSSPRRLMRLRRASRREGEAPSLWLRQRGTPTIPTRTSPRLDWYLGCRCSSGCSTASIVVAEFAVRRVNAARDRPSLHNDGEHLREAVTHVDQVEGLVVVVNDEKRNLPTLGRNTNGEAEMFMDEVRKLLHATSPKRAQKHR